MKELYTNGCTSFIASNVGASDTTIPVMGGNWPTGGQFTVLVDTEYMLVTGVSGTNPINLTVQRAQEGSAPKAHNQGAIIFVDLTDGSFRRLCRQSINGVNYTARRELNFIPVGCGINIADNAATDSSDITITVSSSGGGSGFTAPPQTGWTLLQGTGNTGSFTTDSNGVNIFEAGANSGVNENIKFLYQALPSTPFKIAAVFHVTPSPGNQNGNYGLMLGESASGKLQALGMTFGSTQFNTWCWSSPNNYGGNDPYQQSTGVIFPVYFQIGCDGTNISFSYSGDGINFVTFFTESKTNYFNNGPDQIGFYLNCQSGTGQSYNRLVHWKQT